jgi:CubicO group peptidase (beta-lactamase class C family)
VRGATPIGWASDAGQSETLAFLTDHASDGPNFRDKTEQPADDGKAAVDLTFNTARDRIFREPNMQIQERPSGSVRLHKMLAHALGYAILVASANSDLNAQLPSAAAVDGVFAEFNTRGSVGCALGVARNGELLYKKGYGYANLDWDIPITPTTVFYVGSVSKQFTAAAIALLSQQGKLDLDADVREYVPEMPLRSPIVTARHLIHHTSGVRDMYRVMSENGLTTWNRFSREEALALLAEQDLDFLPGARYQYSNGGYFLLSIIVERVSGKPLKDFANEEIFQPLGMNDTHFHDDPVHIVKRRAMSYMPLDSGGYYQSYQSNFALPGAGGLYSTVEDLLKWDQNFLRHTVGGAELQTTIHTFGRLNSGEELDYAFAIGRSRHRGLPVLGHTGSFMGFKAYYARFPDQRFSVWVLCNMGEIVPEQLGLEVAALYLSNEMTPTRPERPARP